jgi:hypothetical protein
VAAGQSRSPAQAFPIRNLSSCPTGRSARPRSARSWTYSPIRTPATSGRRGLGSRRAVAEAGNPKATTRFANALQHIRPATGPSNRLRWTRNAAIEGVRSPPPHWLTPEGGGCPHQHEGRSRPPLPRDTLYSPDPRASTLGEKPVVGTDFSPRVAIQVIHPCGHECASRRPMPEQTGNSPIPCISMHDVRDVPSQAACRYQLRRRGRRASHDVGLLLSCRTRGSLRRHSHNIRPAVYSRPETQRRRASDSVYRR